MTPDEPQSVNPPPVEVPAPPPLMPGAGAPIVPGPAQSVGGPGSAGLINGISAGVMALAAVVVIVVVVLIVVALTHIF
ncbi:MAG TPA: hypothetical protein VG015_04375 [Candidatus Dormibacteraeota bacterium]|nr:hypothetical protein [Candidatus Dormibacteraeota bacterium]